MCAAFPPLCTLSWAAHPEWFIEHRLSPFSRGDSAATAAAALAAAARRRRAQVRAAAATRRAPRAASEAARRAERRTRAAPATARPRCAAAERERDSERDTVRETVRDALPAPLCLSLLVQRTCSLTAAAAAANPAARGSPNGCRRSTASPASDAATHCSMLFSATSPPGGNVGQVHGNGKFGIFHACFSMLASPSAAVTTHTYTRARALPLSQGVPTQTKPKFG
jgi:hypothetical protein